MGISSSSNCLFLRKAGRIFGKIAEIANGGPASAGFFRIIWKSGKWPKPKPKVGGQNGNPKTIVSDVKDSIRNTFTRMANALSGSEWPNWKLGN